MLTTVGTNVFVNDGSLVGESVDSKVGLMEGISDGLIVLATVG